ncbi:MAG: exo-alpha-sialidase [Bacteroidaceae bacterium]|nr:exo-alpha-sialidase [Bacteroidaceae bacterium]
MKLKTLLTSLLLLIAGAMMQLNAQVAVTVGSQVTDASSIVSGKAYLLRWDGLTGTPYALDTGGDVYSMANNNSATQAAVYYLISDGNGGYKVENAYTGKYWPTPSSNGEYIAPTTIANAGTWTIAASGTANRFTFTCSVGGTAYHTNRSSSKLVAHTSDSPVSIYEVTASTLATAATYSAFADKDISVSATEAASISEGQWYVLKNRGRNGYAFENSGSMKNQGAAPAGSATDNGKFLVRFLNAGDGKYYLQNGLSNFWGAIPQNTAVPATALGTEKYTIGKINSTDGHFYLTSETNGIVLDCQENGYPVVGWGTSIPTTTGGNNDWAFYLVEFVDSWIPTISEVYTINNTNSSRGAMMYNGSSSYVWSSGKSGTFSATDPNCQWVLVPTGTAKQYYLYNVGAGKFAIPSATSSTASWIFSSNAVAVTFITQNDGTKKIKTVTTDTYAAVSNNYTGPIINYNDVGGNFTITKVDGDQSTAATAAFNKLVDNKTAASAVPASGSDGWYIIRIKTHGTYADKYVFPATSEMNYNGTYYPLTFEHGANVRPAIDNVTYYTRISNENGNYYWQMPNGKYLYGHNYKFPISTTTKSNFAMDYTNGSGFRMWGSSRYAVPYLLNSLYFIGETSSSGNAYYDIYPIDLDAAGLTAWQVLCDNAPESAQITCSRSDVSGLTAVYKNGFFFLPTGVTPESTDFNLDGATNVTVDATAKTITFAYDPNLAIVADGVIVEQGWQTAGRDSEVMLLRVTAKPFKDATNVSLTVNLKDGSAANISTLKLYEANNNSPEIYSTGDGAPTKTEVATASISGATATFSIGDLAAGTHYYWIGATVSSTATLGAVLDAAVTGIAYQVEGQTAQNLDLTSVGDPADRGAMVFNVRSYPFLPRDNGSRVYRIPAMIVADDGSIVVAADKRYQSHTDIGNGGHVIDIVVRRSTDGGKTWSAPVTIAKGEGSTASGGDDKRCGFGDPSLVKGKDGKLYCLFAAGNEGYFYGQKGMCMSVSTDNGVTWSSGEGNPPVDLYWSGAIKNVNTAGAAGFGLYDYFVTSGRGLYIPEDDILMYLIPAQTMTSATEHTGDSQDYVFYSRDGGESWYFSETPMVQGGDEAKIIQMNDGSLFGSIRKGGNRRFNTATYTKNDDGKTLSFNFGTQWENSQLYQASQNNQDILYYQRETTTGKTDVIFHSITTGNHVNFKLYYSTDQGQNWTEFLNVQTKGTRYVTMDKNPANGSLYLFFEDQSLNSAGGYTDYNHYPLNFIEITREQLLQYIPELDKSALEENVKIVYGFTGEGSYGTLSGNTWTSNASSGMAGLTLTKSGGEFNKFSNWNDHYNLAYKPAAANTASTLTLTAPEGYVITGYSLLAAKASSAAHTYTLTAEDGTTVTPAFASSANDYTAFNIDGINAPSTTISVTTTDASKWLSLANFVVTLYPIFDYTRAVTPGRWGTVCVPGAVAAANISGAEIYRIAGKTVNAEDKPTSLKVEQVEDMEAGKPYLFLPSESQLSLTYYGSTIVNTPGSENGLIGSFTGMDVAPGYYLLSNNKIVLCGANCDIAANRAYIDMDAVPLYTGETGVKSLDVYCDDPDGISLVPDTTPEGDGRIYDLSGRYIGNSRLPKGIYIVNGRKIVIK